MSEPDATAIHIWRRCNHCGAAPITGRCFRCVSCRSGPDNDLCQRCYDLLRAGRIEHPAPGQLMDVSTDGAHEFRTDEGSPAGEFAVWLDIAEPDSPPPAVDGVGFIVRPAFHAGAQTAFGAYGTVVEIPGGGGEGALLSALHIMDEILRHHAIDATVTNTDYTGRELPAVITGVTLYDVFAKPWMLAELGNAGPMMVLPDARVDEPAPATDRDLAVCRVPEPTPCRAGRLAPRLPAVGEPVWLVVSGPDANQVFCAAVVVESTARTLVFRYTADCAPRPRYTSGAPLLDTAGEVVGIHIGAGAIGHRALGRAHGCESLRHHLRVGVGLAGR